MSIDLNQENAMVYEALIHAIRTNSGIGFHNNDQGHPAYAIYSDGSPSQNMGDSPEENDLFKTLQSLTEELGERAHTPIRTWIDFCRLAAEGYQRSLDKQK